MVDICYSRQFFKNSKSELLKLKKKIMQNVSFKILNKVGPFHLCMQYFFAIFRLRFIKGIERDVII